MNLQQEIHLPHPSLVGVHHTARPTWKLEETVRFYREQLGLPLVHAISAKGWGPEEHADFLHFFFDSGCGSTIAFFYYIGTERPDWLVVNEHYQYRATHTAWRVESREQLLAWRERVEKVGIPFRYQIQHEVIESIYFNDPNGYPIEITWQMRSFSEADRHDADMTLRAGIECEQARNAGSEFSSIDAVWQRKAAHLDAEQRSNGAASIYVLDVPEFRPLVDLAQRSSDYATSRVSGNYIRIDGTPELRFKRKELGFNHAVWYGVLTGGFAGHVKVFDKNEIVVSGV